MVDAMRSRSSGRGLAALGRVDVTSPIPAVSVTVWRREAHARRRPAPPAAAGGSGPDTPDRAPERARSWRRPSGEQRGRVSGPMPVSRPEDMNAVFAEAYN